MSIEAALRRHVEHDWLEPWACHEFPVPLVEQPSVDDDHKWKVIKFPVYTRRRAEAVPARIARSDASVELRRLADEWRAATLFLSSTQEMFLHPAYQQIIGFGEKALPFLIDELRSSDDYWFWALNMITRVNPVPADQNGNFPAMKQAWLEWAVANNL